MIGHQHTPSVTLVAEVLGVLNKHYPGCTITPERMEALRKCLVRTEWPNGRVVFGQKAPEQRKA